MTAPTLHTARLTLRPLCMADYPAFAAFMASPRSAHMGGPYDTFGTWALFCHDAGQWALFGHGGLMIDLTATGETVGSVCLSHGPLFPEPELGWFLYDGHEGKGYATEAATALRDWAFATLGLTTMVSYVDPPNRASAAVAKRLGASLDPDAPRQPGDEGDLVFRHPRPQATA
ncbi:GNAT family N-acetyltransferase [Fertoebacter nigrum]|uniref:GNAT family N-acetyltransferase n=1 Tax=Fertoeibacter niger TaxID=2656921 RepID=A0A8X8GUW9_9RHOB|nr:GNAT family N-acetyltransferase [Fertoeibacter niger]NUB44799.1 GNAT family N-acetyltransferase [Fertoeibacter niger]